MTKQNEAADNLLLALETSGDTCGFALLCGERLIAEHTFRHEMRLSERLIEFTDRLLRDANTELAAIDAFAVGIGPGSFTGVRIGVMTAKTWASVLGKPLFGVNSLEALASEYAGLTDTLVIPLLPCRAGIVYAASYKIGTGVLEPLKEPDALSIADAAALVVTSPAHNVIFCGAAALNYRAELSAALPTSEQSISFGQAEFARAAQVARIALRRAEIGSVENNALNLLPLYIVPPQISAPKIPFAVVTAKEGN